MGLFDLSVAVVEATLTHSVLEAERSHGLPQQRVTMMGLHSCMGYYSAMSIKADHLGKESNQLLRLEHENVKNLPHES